MKRSGCKPGDAVYITRGAGLGNALGMARLAGMPDAAFPEGAYRPQARLDAGLLLRDFASCCMDSSDGLLATLDQLMRVNGCGFVIEREWQDLLSPEVAKFCAATRTPAWLMSGGPHGEFELVFAVRPERETAMLEAAKAKGISLVRVGKVQEHQAVAWTGRSIDVAHLRNLLYEVGGDLKRYLAEFLAFGAKNNLT
jgi:thiamine-monophosphate kinase